MLEEQLWPSPSPIPIWNMDHKLLMQMNDHNHHHQEYRCIRSSWKHNHKVFNSSPSPSIVTWSGLQCALEATEEEKEDVLQKILAPGHDPEIYCSKPSKTIFGLVYYWNSKNCEVHDPEHCAYHDRDPHHNGDPCTDCDTSGSCRCLSSAGTPCMRGSSAPSPITRHPPEPGPEEATLQEAPSSLPPSRSTASLYVCSHCESSSCTKRKQINLISFNCLGAPSSNSTMLQSQSRPPLKKNSPPRPKCSCLWISRIPNGHL